MELDTVLGQLPRHDTADVLNESQAHAVLALDLIPHLQVADGIQVLHTQVLQLLLDLLHTQAVGQGGVDLHGLQGGDAALVIGLGVQCAHVVQTVAELDENDADVLGHGQKHLAESLDVSLLLVVDLQGHDLGQTLHQHGHVGAEALGDLLAVGLFSAILHRVVEQGGADGVGIQLQSRHDLGHGDGVGDVGITALAELPLVELGRIVKGGLDLLKIVPLARGTEYFK